MRSGWMFLLSGIAIIIIGITWILLGGMADGSSIPLIGQDLIPGNPVPTTTMPSPGPTIEPVTSRPTPVISLEDVKLHFLDLAFGEGASASLRRWDASANNGRIVIAVNGGNKGDTAALQSAAQQFNSISLTSRLSENIKEGDYGDISIRFIPDTGMDGIALNSSDRMNSRELTRDGITAAKIVPGSIYINASLSRDARTHILLRSLFYELGVVGYTNTYPDSLFYSDENTNTKLSEADQKAIAILYGTSLTPGMSAGDVKNILFVT